MLYANNAKLLRMSSQPLYLSFSFTCLLNTLDLWQIRPTFPLTWNLFLPLTSESPFYLSRPQRSMHKIPNRQAKFCYLDILRRVHVLCTPASPKSRAIDLLENVIEAALMRVVPLNKTGRCHLFIWYLAPFHSGSSVAVFISTLCGWISRESKLS